MTLASFIFGVVIVMFGYNIAITIWQEYRQRRLQRKRDNRDFRNRY